KVGPSVLMMDLRSKECRELIDQIQSERSDILIIAFGVAQSETLREAEQFGIYAAEEIALERRRFQALLGRAFDYLKVSQENRDLRETSTMTPEVSRKSEVTPEALDVTRTLPLLRFPRVLRRQDTRQRTIMRRALDMFGAEAIVPLYARGSIIGWVFFGHRVTGQLFDDHDLEGLTTLAENVSTMLENALLYEEATIQKTLA